MSAWYLLLALLFVLANGFFVASEFALVKVRPTQFAELIEHGSKRAKMTKRILKRLDAYLAAAQVGITFASLALGWIGEPAFATLIIPLFKSLGIFAEPIAHSIAIDHLVHPDLGPAHHLRRAGAEVSGDREAGSTPRSGPLTFCMASISSRIRRSGCSARSRMER